MANLRNDYIQLAESSLKTDPDLNNDGVGERYFRKDGWLKDLPQTAQEMIAAVQAAGEHPDRPVVLQQCAAQHFAFWNRSKSRDQLESAIAFHAASVKYTKSDDRQRPARLSDLAFSTQARWELTKDGIDLDNTVHLFRKGLDAAETLDQPLGSHATNLAYILYQRWHRTKTQNDREEARANFLRAIELAAEHPFLPQMLSNYGEFLRLTSDPRSGRYNDDIEEAIVYQARAVDAPVPDVPLPYDRIWRNLAIAHHTRFKINHSEDDFQTAIKYYKASIALAGPHQAKTLSELADHHLELFDQRRTREGLEEAIAIYDRILSSKESDFAATIGKADTLRKLADLEVDAQKSQHVLREACRLADKAVLLVEESNNSRGWAYFRTSAIYMCQFEVDGKSEYLDKSVEMAIKSLAYTKHTAIWDFGRWCASVCRTRHVDNGKMQDLEQAFTAINIAIENLDEWDLENLAQCTWMLGVCCLSRFHCTGEMGDLDESLTWLTASCLPAPVPSQAHSLGLVQNDLANALCTKFEHSSSVADLDRAIENYTLAGNNFQRAGLALNHGDFSMIRNGIGQAMLQRYKYWGIRDDLASSIDAFSSSFKATDVRNARIVGRACNLSYALQLMFNLDNNIQWLRRAQKYLTMVLESGATYGAHLDQLVNSHMGHVYLRCYIVDKKLEGLDRAVSYYEGARRHKLDDKRVRAVVTNNLALALGKKANQSQKETDFQASIAMYKEAEALEEARSTYFLVTRLNKAEVYLSMFETSEKREFGVEALEVFRSVAVAETAQFDIRLRAADAASMLEVRVNGDFEAAFEQILKAIKSLPEVISLLSSRLEQLRFVRKYHYLPSSATALAIAAKVPPERIVTMLEMSRSFIWDRFLLAESHFDGLRNKHPELADRLDTLRAALTPQVDNDSNISIATMVSTKDQRRLDRHNKSNEYQQLIKEIQREDGFENFPLPSDQEGSLDMSENEAIVFVNMSHYRCDAIIQTSEGVRVLALIGVSQDQVIDNAAILQYSLSGNMDEDKPARFDGVMRWLWYAVAKPILDTLTSDHSLRETPSINGQYKVFWVTYGWLGMFPIHAAGDFSIPQASVHDQCLSISIPSIRVLHLVRQRQREYSAKTLTSHSALLIGMPTTPGMGPDSAISAEAEISSIVSILKPSIATIDKTLSPTFETVTSSLPAATLAHFATHATADAHDPSLSAIRLVDWQTRPLNVRAFLGQEMAPLQARSVFLSACETAMSKDLLTRDEGVHVAGAFLMKGATSVVAGLWKVQDQAAREVAEGFYKGLIDGEGDVNGDDKHQGEAFGMDQLRLIEEQTTGLRFDRAAEALHRAIGDLRKRGLPAIIWGAFVYMGP